MRERLVHLITQLRIRTTGSLKASRRSEAAQPTRHRRAHSSRKGGYDAMRSVAACVRPSACHRRRAKPAAYRLCETPLFGQLPRTKRRIATSLPCPQQPRLRRRAGRHRQGKCGPGRVLGLGIEQHARDRERDAKRVGHIDAVAKVPHRAQDGHDAAERVGNAVRYHAHAREHVERGLVVQHVSDPVHKRQGHHLGGKNAVEVGEHKEPRRALLVRRRVLGRHEYQRREDLPHRQQAKQVYGAELGHVEEHVERVAVVVLAQLLGVHGAQAEGEVGDAHEQQADQAERAVAKGRQRPAQHDGRHARELGAGDWLRLEEEQRQHYGDQRLGRAQGLRQRHVHHNVAGVDEEEASRVHRGELAVRRLRLGREGRVLAHAGHAE
mmetsp:Transcript_18092/g.45966  ORF Transcript_18092/g.45966 Transcript_18092/m.45966 type:complete len:381 (-) Transcript_18092:233-1375(-)